MEQVLKCPLCCDKTFESKLSLVGHLTSLISNLSCPVCDNKWSSIAHLIEHLALDNCRPETSSQTFDAPKLEEEPENIRDIKPCSLGNEDEDLSSQHKKNNESLDMNNSTKMYAVLLEKDMLKPCLQTQELKFIEENGQSRFVFMEEIDSDLESGNAVVTKQNNDGTISMTTVKDLKMESETMLSSSENEPDDNQEEIYSCNSCGVSFSSVIEHIQNYHNDQEVVVEEPVLMGSNQVVIDGDTETIEYDPMMTEGSVNNTNFTPRRMITETGDIVEAPINMKSIDKAKDSDKATRGPSRRYVQIDKFCDSHVKDIKPNKEKDGPFHRAVVKEMETTEGTKVKMYQCIVCDVYVTALVDLQEKPCKPLKYSCPHCPVAYENSKSLCAHMKVHKSLKTEPTTYNCEICCTMFLTNKSLKLHKRMHDPVKSRPIARPVKSLDGSTDVTEDCRYLCNICNTLIPVEYRIIHDHSHKSSNKLNCTVCNKKFQSTEYLEMHMKAHNLNKIPENKTDKSLPYSCVYCPRRFSRPHEKVKHERIHTGEKPHSCEICGKSFRVSYCLTLHMRTHTGARPYACPHCGKRFKAHSVYNHHLLTHSEKRAYKCPMCPKAFKTSVQLAGHKKCHTKPFSCQHCNRPFASLYAVRVHMETHARQNNLKFTCPLCGARYARAFALKDHVKQVHKLDGDAIEKMQSEGGEKDWMISEPVETSPNEVEVIKHTIEEVDIPTSKDNSLITILDIHTDEMIVP